MIVEPIKDKKKINDFLAFLKGKNERDWIMAKFQLNTGLRISDVVKAKVSDVLTKKFNSKDYFVLQEQKTNKEKKIKLNDSIKTVLSTYVKQNNLVHNNYIFRSRKGLNEHITVTQAYRLLKNAAVSTGIENFGTHSLRKTWGYWTYKVSRYNIDLIMETFNHSSQKMTLRYIGIDQGTKDEFYSLVQNAGQMNFLSEMSERQISAHEFFGNVLLDSLNRNFGLEKVLISFFDTHGKFLSWINWNGIVVDCEEHPYRKFIASDVIRNMVYQDAVRDHLTYFNVIPRLYKSTDIINPVDYDHSAYVRFLEENFHAHYSVTMAFGINAYIQVVFFKCLEKGDFTDEEIEALNKIYVYVANSYKNFKKHEQAKIVSNIQSEIISSGEKAYLVTGDFMHIMSYNEMAKNYLKDILGPSIAQQISSTSPCSWLPFLLGDEEDNIAEKRVQTRVIKNYIFKIYTYDQSYSNGIIDRYHWITISRKEEGKISDDSGTKPSLTQAEQRVAELLYNGLTYKDIADELVVSYHTVKKHVQNIYTKCGVKSRFQLYKWIENTEQ